MNTASDGYEGPTAPLQPAAPPVEFSAEQLRFHVTVGSDFRTTEELDPRHDFTGQERARAALDLGLGVASSGFNIFVSGLTGIEKLEALRNWVSQQAAQAPARVTGCTYITSRIPMCPAPFRSPQDKAAGSSSS